MDDRRDWALQGTTTQIISCDSRETAEEHVAEFPHLTALTRIPGGEWEPVNGRRELVSQETEYAIQFRQDGGPWHRHITASAIRDEAEARDYIADLKALAQPGFDFRAVERLVTHTALSQGITATPADIEPGPVPARKLRSGSLINWRGWDRLVWSVEYNHNSHAVRVFTVPPNDLNPHLFAYTLSPGELVELVAQGPAVDLTGQPVDATV